MATTRDARFPDPTTEGEVDFRGHRTWYRITGELDPDAAQAPLVVLHGGPGAAHNYTLMMANLAGRGRAVVHYDQLGCGGSTHLPDASADFWTPQLFVDELRNLVEALGIDQRFHLLGQSWGGMLGPEVVLADDAGIRTLTICDSPASMELWLEAANTLRAQLAEKVFYDRHVCRVVPNPPEVTDSFAQIEDEPTVYHTMNGPSEFHVVGSLKDWSVVDRLDGIRVPTLVVAGAHDEAMPLVWEPFT